MGKLKKEQKIAPKRRWFLWISLPLLVFLAIPIFSPLLLHIDSIKEKIILRLGQELHCEIILQDVRWNLFPLPHMVIMDLKVEKTDFSLHLPETEIYPNWLSLLHKKTNFGEIRLYRPLLRLPMSLSESSSKNLNLPAVLFKIFDGEFLMTGSPADPSFSNYIPKELKHLSGTIKTLPDSIAFNLKGATDFCQSANLNGKLMLENNQYQINFKLRNFDLTKWLSKTENNSLIACDSPVDISGAIRGEGKDTISANISGSLPPYTIQTKTHKTLLEFGRVDLVFHKTPLGRRLFIKKLDLENPKLRLSGNVSREKTTDGKPPVWTLDLRADDLDIESIRTALLEILGQDEIVDLVCKIVLGGSAQWATYQFEGPTTDFKHLEKMSITVGGIKAPIYIPWADLSLRDAMGEISIINGYLAGEGLTTWLGNSFGKNCSLFLDLTNRGNDFKLDLDIDADLLDLSPALYSLIDWPPFINQLNKFSEVRGKARGKLQLGDTLDNIITKVDVSSMQGSFSYEPINRPIQIFSGSLVVGPEKVRWKNIKATSGDQQIRKATGSVEWTEEIFITIEDGTANLDAHPFYQELQRHDLIPARVSRSISDLSGRIIINNLNMNGPPHKPELWAFNMDYAMQGLKLTSPMLPYPILFEKNQGIFSQNTLSMSDCRAWLLEQPYILEGEFSHKLLTDWQGNLSTSGLVREPLAGWIRKKGWIPPSFFPAIPCRLDNFTISWDDTRTSLKGIIQAGDSPVPPSVFLDLDISTSEVRLHKARFSDGQYQGSLEYFFQRQPPYNLGFTWKGELLGQTLDQLLADNRLLSGSINGDFDLFIHKDAEHSTALGELNASGFKLPFANTKLPVQEISLIGEGNKLIINNLLLEFNKEIAAISGRLEGKPEGLAVDLDLHADQLAWQPFADMFIPPSQKIKAPEGDDNFLKNSSIQGWDVIGTCNFQVQQFTKARGVENAEKPITPYVWTPLNGQVEWAVENGIFARISQSTFCNLPMLGSWCSNPTLGKNTLLIKTAVDEPALFQQVLPCLGSANLIDGPFDLDASLQYEDGNWSIGKFKVHSPGGHIKRLVLLSKVFSVLNVTELFTGSTFQDLANDGFPYSSMDIEGHIKDNLLSLERAVIQGDGLNLFAKGNIALDTLETDLVLLVAPFKTMDLIVTSVPLIGKAVAGENEALFTIPVGITGPLKEPEITPLPAKAVAQGILDLVTNTLKLPYTILSPIIENSEDEEDGK